MPEFWARSKYFKINQPIRLESHKRCHFNGCNNHKKLNELSFLWLK
ncbi:hypothetical protein EJK51_0583 [Moraxella catarrhalis]|nr:hypothetical protein MCR_0556 [Moraxella catarrhalis BBH18]AZQ87512.1 hypothetical protein EJK52_0585 [Moraxella catarrhalis]AZQ91224.1 hypothetical protein EJK51_0583 [Moraxella catarrhalis]